MKSVFHSFCLFLLFAAGLFTFSGYSQSSINNNSFSNVSDKTDDYPEWIKMMRDPRANFFETQKAFNKYFENRDKGKGTGYKQFKRWEYRMQSRILPELMFDYLASLHIYFEVQQENLLILAFFAQLLQVVSQLQVDRVDLRLTDSKFFGSC